MSEVTIELVHAKQAEIVSMIEELQRKSRATTLRLPAFDVVLQPGEWYAGAVLNEDGSVKHHTIVAAVSDDDLNFDNTQAFAKRLGLSAPTTQEASLIFAHKYGRLAGKGGIWTCEPHQSNSASAWGCDLLYGYVSYGLRSSELGAVAVRRLIPSIL